MTDDDMVRADVVDSVNAVIIGNDLDVGIFVVKVAVPVPGTDVEIGDADTVNVESSGAEISIDEEVILLDVVGTIIVFEPEDDGSVVVGVAVTDIGDVVDEGGIVVVLASAEDDIVMEADILGIFVIASEAVNIVEGVHTTLVAWYSWMIP